MPSPPITISNHEIVKSGEYKKAPFMTVSKMTDTVVEIYLEGMCEENWLEIHVPARALVEAIVAVMGGLGDGEREYIQIN